VTCVPDGCPDGGEADRLTDEQTAEYVKWSAAEVALVPEVVVTVTSTVPAV